MRVISGTARGTKLETVEGLDTRPTTDRVKENIFNTIQFEITGERVLDLFAGSGALGIEAASRGAAHVTMVESSPVCARITQRNIVKTHLEEKIQLVVKPVEQALFQLPGSDRFHVIFMDPPYDEGLVEPTLESIVELDLVDSGGIVVVEHRTSLDVPDVVGCLELGRSKKYGGTTVSIYRRTQQ